MKSRQQIKEGTIDPEFAIKLGVSIAEAQDAAIRAFKGVAVTEAKDAFAEAQDAAIRAFKGVAVTQDALAGFQALRDAVNAVVESGSKVSTHDYYRWRNDPLKIMEWLRLEWADIRQCVRDVWGL